MNVVLSFLLLFSTQPDTVIVQVIKVRDGDTIEIQYANGKITPVRFHGIDSPDRCQDRYEDAKQFTARILLNKKVKFVQTGTDQYKRAVGEIFVDADNTSGDFEVWFNAAIVGSGYAWFWPQYSDSKKLAALQVTAQKLKAGVWQDKNPIAPWVYRRSNAYKECTQTF